MNRSIQMMLDTHVDVMWVIFETVVDVSVNTEIATTTKVVQGERNVRASEAPFLLATPQFDLLEMTVQRRRLDVVVITYDQTLLAIKARQKIANNLVVTTIATSYITKMIHLIAGHYNFIPLVNHELIHLLRILERTSAIRDDIFMKEMSVTDEPFLSHVMFRLCVVVDSFYKDTADLRYPLD